MNALPVPDVTEARARPAAPAHVTVRAPRVLIARGRDTGGSADALDRSRVDALVGAGHYVRAPVPSAVVYRIATAGHQQTGIVLDVAIGDYRDGRIRRHETTEPARERKLARRLAETGVQQVPVALADRMSPRLRGLLADVAAGEPDVTRVDDNGDAHTVWSDGRSAVVGEVQHELDLLGALFITDGHHRMAAADRHFRGLAEPNVGGHALAVLFPTDEMRVFGYHRYLDRPSGMSTPDLVAMLAERPAVARVEECATAAASRPEPGVVAMCAGGRWFRVVLGSRRAAVPAREALDVVTLDEAVLAPLFGITDMQAYARAAPPPGGGDTSAAAAWCSAHDTFAFLLAPPSVEQLMTVSDSGGLLPPKSTWFAPKARAGLLLRELP